MTNTLADWQEVKIDRSRERRQQPRSEIRIPIEVCGFNKHSRFFTEKTVTHDVSDSGCRFNLRTEVEKESVIAIRVINHKNGCEVDSRPVLFQVNWFRELPDGYTLGASKLQPGPVWSVQFTEMKNYSQRVS